MFFWCTWIKWWIEWTELNSCIRTRTDFWSVNSERYETVKHQNSLILGGNIEKSPGLLAVKSSDIAVAFRKHDFSWGVRWRCCQQHVEMAVCLEWLTVCSTLWVWVKTVLSYAKSYKGLYVPMFWRPQKCGDSFGFKQFNKLPAEVVVKCGVYSCSP